MTHENKNTAHAIVPWKTTEEGVKDELRDIMTDIVESIGGLTYPKLKIPEVEGHKNNIRCQCVSHDGRFLVIGAQDGLVMLWDLDTCRITSVFKGHTAQVSCVALNHDATRIASSSRDHTIRIWDVQTGESQVLEGHTDGVFSVAFNKKGNWVVCGGKFLSVILWNLETGLPIKSYKAHTNSIFKVMFSHDESTILGGGGDGRLIEWELKSGRPSFLIPDNGGDIDDFALDPQERHIVTASRDSLIKLYHRKTGKFIRAYASEGKEIEAIAFSKDGKMVAAGGEAGLLKLFDTHSGKCLQLFKGHLDTVMGISFLSDHTLITSSFDCSIRRWRKEHEASVQIISNQIHFAIRTLTLGGEGRYLALGGGNQKAILFDLDTGKKIREFSGHTNVVRDMRLSADNQYLYTGSWDGTAGKWRVDTGKREAVFAGHDHRIYSLHLSKNERFLYTSCQKDGCLKKWSTHTPICEKTLSGHGEMYAISGNETLLAVASGNDIRLWDLATFSYQDLKGHTDEVYSLFIHPTRPLLLSSSKDHTVRLWNTEKRVCETVFTGHHDYVTKVIADEAWQFAFSVGYDHTLCQWNLETGALEEMYHGNQAKIHGLCLDSRNNHVITGSDDGTVRFWDISSRKQIATLHLGRDDLVLWTIEPESEGQTDTAPPRQDIFFYTETPDLLEINEVDPHGKVLGPLQKEERRLHIAAFNREDIVMARISNPARYRELMKGVEKGLTQHKDEGSIKLITDASALRLTTGKGFS